MGRRRILRLAARQWLGRWFLRRLWRPNGLPRHLVAIELLGALSSPLAYRSAQAQARRVAATYREPDAGRYSVQAVGS